MPRRRKKNLVTVRNPRLRLSGKGVKLIKPYVRIGGKAGVNVSSRGVSASLRTSAGAIGARQGITLSPFGWLKRLFRLR
jgi:hypothetical protein